MSPFGRRDAAALARALESDTTQPLPGAALAARLRVTGAALEAAVAPRPEFRDALRMRLLAVAAVQAAAPAAAPAAGAAPLGAAVSWRRRGGAVAAGAMASVVATTGVAVAGSQSLPGDPFYGVKRTIEALQLSTADGALEEGAQHLDFAGTRLREVRGLTLGRDAARQGPDLGLAALGGRGLAASSRPLGARAALSPEVAARVRATLAEMDEQTREGSELLTAAYRSSRAPEPLKVLDRFASRQSAGLAQLLPELPVQTEVRALASLALLSDVSETTDALLATGACTQGCDPTDAAPTLSVTPGATPATPTPSPSCLCEPAPAPEPEPAPSPTAPQEPEPEPTPEQTEQAEPSQAPSPEPSSPEPSASPSPSPSPSSLLPPPGLLPALPLPLPTRPLAPALLTGAPPAADSRPQDASASSPLPQLAPEPTRP